MPFPSIGHDDLYKHALSVMLSSTPYVAAIIPESFLTQGLFHDRLSAVISLTCRMFEDTEVPVCLALFVPTAAKKAVNDFDVYAENRLIGTYAKLKDQLERFEGEGYMLRFNDPNGQIGLLAVDSQEGPTIKFVRGKEIDSSVIKSSSRSITKISCPLEESQVERVIRRANQLLKIRRDATKDTFMTAFKGLRKDGRYRRRLDFAQARELINLAIVKEGLDDCAA